MHVTTLLKPLILERLQQKQEKPISNSVNSLICTLQTTLKPQKIVKI